MMRLVARSLCNRSSVAVSLLCAMLFVPRALADAGLDFELDVTRHFRGPVQRIVVEPSGDSAWLATPGVLYQVQNGAARTVDTGPPNKLAELVLAPGGAMHAWLVLGEAPQGLFTIQLMTTPANLIAVLRLDKFPYGFGALYIGKDGNLIVTVSPLDDPEGIDGRFLYIFWSKDGKPRAEIKLSGRRIGLVDPAGTALLLLGESDAIAFSAAGEQLWQYKGKYRKAALAADAKVAILNPAQKDGIQDIHVFKNNKAVVVKMSSPVHGLALTPDGSLGAVAIDQGQLLFISTGSGEFKTVSRLPVDETFFITALSFLDSNTIAVGVIQRTGKAPRFTFPSGAVLAVTTNGQVLFQLPFPLQQPPTYAPSLDVTYGVRRFAAHTPRNALFFKLDK